MPRLTKTLVDHLSADDKEVSIRDTLLPGFLVRLRPGSAVKRFYVQYRTPEGIHRKRPIGVYGVLTVEEARQMARQHLAAVARGADPAGKPKHVRRTVAALATQYLEEYASVHKQPSSVRSDRYNLRLHILPALGTLDVTQVERAQVVELHAAMRHTPGAANRCLSLLSKMFALSEQWQWREAGRNPVMGIQRYREKTLERFLTPEEVKHLLTVLDEIETLRREHPSVVGAIRLLLFTGARVGELLSLQWGMIDWERGWARVPTSKTGAKTLYMAPEALEVLESLPRVEGNRFCLPGIKSGRSWHSLRWAWGRIRKEAGIPDVRLHDLRHTFASAAARVGYGLPMIGALLGHKQAATTQRYVHLVESPVQEAAKRTARALGGNR